jgi:hypothetical protein
MHVDVNADAGLAEAHGSRGLATDAVEGEQGRPDRRSADEPLEIARIARPLVR